MSKTVADLLKQSSKEERGKRDGTGPYHGGIESLTGKQGKRKRKGEKCPEETKKEAGVGSEALGRLLHTQGGGLLGAALVRKMFDTDSILPTIAGYTTGVAGSGILNSIIGSMRAENALRDTKPEDYGKLREDSNKQILQNLLIPGRATKNTLIANATRPQMRTSYEGRGED